MRVASGLVLGALLASSVMAQAPRFQTSQADGIAPVSAASPGAPPAPPPPMAEDPQAGRHLVPGEAPRTSAARTAPPEPGAAHADVPGTAGIPGVPDRPLGAPMATLPSPGAPADTLPGARGQDITPDAASAPGAPGVSRPSGNYLVMNAYLLAGMLVLGVIIFMLAFPSRRQQA